MPQTNSTRSTAKLTAEMLRLMQTQPGEWTVDRFITELGESESRVYRVMAGIEAAGWTVTRTPDGTSKRLSLSTGQPI